MLLEELKNRNITVWGDGREGRAVQIFLEHRNNNVKTVVDPVSSLSGVIVKSPGISNYRSEISNAKRFGSVFTSGTNLFMEAALMMPEDRPFLIGVTGTKGKSTTSSLIYHVLKELGYRVGLCGNIGIPAIELAEHLEDYDVIVVEMSSYQCTDLIHGFDLTVVLNLYPEHIDWHLTHENYYKDKLNILRVRDPGKKAIVNYNNGTLAFHTREEKDLIHYNNMDGVHEFNGWFYDGTEKLFTSMMLPLKGAHNIENICAVLSVMKELGVELTECEAHIRSFEPLPHRLQEIAFINGVRYVDDSISTTPETAIAAMKSYTGCNIILLAGGHDREQDYVELAKYVKDNDIPVLAMPPTGRRICEEVEEAGGIVYEVKDMKEAVVRAFSMAKPGDVVLLSPAAPSYGVYKNFEERGDVFKENVLSLDAK
ncbi:MAG: UDP-N-acetylmuramoyl-L-alanine--D-glutamate ligase [Alphaproteobacteria bacterium]|nr:UDP-N-acetylmuramoyl-L-alanine--D-glutamate ligase [Alphaproteobacteria bacterium]